MNDRNNMSKPSGSDAWLYEGCDCAEQLPALVNGALGAKEKALLREHLESCASCNALLRMLAWQKHSKTPSERHAAHEDLRDAFREPPQKKVPLDIVLKNETHGCVNGDKSPGRGEQGIPAGTRVLQDAEDARFIMRYTEENLKLWERQNRTWSPNSWFTRASQTDDARLAQEQCGLFACAIQKNLLAAPRTPFPFVHRPWWLWLLPVLWTPKVKHVKEAAVLDKELARRLGAKLQTPGIFPEAVCAFSEGMNALRVFEIRGVIGSIHVVSAFFTPFSMGADGVPVFRAPGQPEFDIVEQVYREWLEKGKRRRRKVFFALGGIQEPVSGSMPLDCGFYAWPDGGMTECWRHIPAEQAAGLPAHQLLGFLPRLLPETEDTRARRIKGVVDQCMREGGNTTVERVMNKGDLKWPENAAFVEAALYRLQDAFPDTYRLDKTNNGLLAIRSVDKYRPDPIKLRAPGIGRDAFLRFVLQVIWMTILSMGFKAFLASVPAFCAPAAPLWKVFLIYVVYNTGIAVLRKRLG